MTDNYYSPAAEAASAVADAATAASAAISSLDTSGLYTNNNIVSNALFSTIGDAQFFEESISPSTVRSQLVVTGDPSNPSTTLNLLKGMKWLLANMSKGRNVNDFFPHVVKLVGVPNLEVRKMVYIYLARYANHDNSCRELALLSINAFQRGLADHEPLLRSLALRVLTCMDVPDVLQLQILGVRQCSKDTSPYVRKCAVSAVGKLHPRCLEVGDGVQADELISIVTNLLEEDGSTMVLTSAMIAFCEICPQRLELLHGCYRKVCHLLTDMDEWGQVVVMDALMQYCRTYFKQPRGQVKGSAERIDQERRVTRNTRKLSTAAVTSVVVGDVENGDVMLNGDHSANDTLLSFDTTIPPASATNGSSTTTTLPPRQKSKVKRRVVRKAFYSDEEDESSEEEVDPSYPMTGGNVAAALREQPILGSPDASKGFFRDDVNAAANENREHDNFGWKSNVGGVQALALSDDDEDSDLHEDHKLLLESSLPLLKSRNSAVVLTACSLHYHCGIASIKIRSALGKAMVRIHRDRREIQYIVLVSIRTLVKDCPSAFSPFLNDFFVKGMDPSFTRMIKLDILVSLSTDPKAINDVLTELRTYVRHSDKVFACAAIRSVGKVAELARVVYDRRAHIADDELDANSAREESNIIALNCLSGLVTLSEFSKNAEVVGECAGTMQRILSQLLADDGMTNAVKDPAGIQERALKRLLLILMRYLSSDIDDLDEEKPSEQTRLQLKTVRVPDSAVASIIFIVGEWLTIPTTILTTWSIDEISKSKIRIEILRLLAKQFTTLEPQIKLQAVHFASKVLLMLKTSQLPSSDASDKECAVSELVLSMARVDVLQDVRDRARYEGNVLHMSVRLTCDTSALQQLPTNAATSVSVEMAKSMLLHRKPNASSLPLDSKELGTAKHETDLLRFGTLGNVLSTRTIGSTISLPAWAETDSPGSLRDPSTAAAKPDQNTDMYSSSSEDESSSSDDSSSSSSSSSGSSEGDESSESESSDSSQEVDALTDNKPIENGGFGMDKPIMSTGRVEIIPSLLNNDEDDESSSLDSSSSGSSDSDDDSSESQSKMSARNGKANADPANPIPSVGDILDIETSNLSQVLSKQTTSSSSVAAGLEGLVMTPLVGSKDNMNKPSNIDDESGAWKEFVKPELSGGLLVRMRFVRGRSRTKESQLMGIDPNNPSTVCLQVHVENVRPDGTLRHIRIVHRGGTSSGIISPSKVITPPEIPVLKKGMASTLFIGLTFASATDRDGVTVAKFDVKSDRGTTSIEVRPTLGQLLNDSATKSLSQSDFDSAISSLQGIQRITSTFTLSPMNEDVFNNLPSTILQHLNLKQIGEWSGIGSFVGTLPASGQNVYVIVKCDSGTGCGDLIVCSNDAMAANSITNLMKKQVLK